MHEQPCTAHAGLGICGYSQADRDMAQAERDKVEKWARMADARYFNSRASQCNYHGQTDNAVLTPLQVSLGHGVEHAQFVCSVLTLLYTPIPLSNVLTSSVRGRGRSRPGRISARLHWGGQAAQCLPGDGGRTGQP